jgi:F-type H+-transporting ATPase subunit alpha
MSSKIKADEIISVLTKQISEFDRKADTREVGTVLEVGDGIARCYGLSDVMTGEMIDFPAAGVKGLAFNLEENSVSVIVLGDYLKIREGMEVRTTGQLLRVPTGRAMIGRVIDPLGNPMDGKGPIITNTSRLVESPAPGIVERQPVKQPLQTGIKAIDAMTPVGKGQRELIIGDRKTGKTAIAIDTIINQASENVICVYVACGMMEAKVAGVVEKLREAGAMEYTVVIVASASDAAPLQYIAPYAGAAIAEHFMYEEGADTLCVYDDLSKQAAAYRQLSLLVRRPPGREAYPGDVFYCHSRLLERSAKLCDRWVILDGATDDKKCEADWGINSEKNPTQRRGQGEKGAVYLGPPGKEQAEKDIKNFPGAKLGRVWNSGGSLTALPIIETLEGEVSAYIPTNVISITDGQIYLQPDLFFKGQRPAMNVGISVSRVGGAAQNKAMKKVAGGLRLNLAAFRELEAFAQLGTELDPEAQSRLDRGYRMIELLKQGQYVPMHVADQVMVIYAGTRGFLDTIPVKLVRAWETEFIQFMKDQKPEIRNRIVETQDLDSDSEKRLGDALREFRSQFDAKHAG